MKYNSHLIRTLLSGIYMLAVTHLVGQDKSDSLTITGYAEAYYSYDFNRPSNNTRPSFLYNYNRHNEFNINLGYVKAGYANGKVRANVALAAGTYMNANYATESGVLKNIFEANVGYKLSRSGNIWFDIGIMPSHIGFESAVGKDNWTLTRSLVAENSPYFESGAKLSYTSRNNKLNIAALALNGWQRITRVDGNSLMSWGTQINYKASDKLTLNYSTFLGTDKPDSARLVRTYHNAYAVWLISPKFGLTTGMDIGTEGGDTWYAPVAILRYVPESHWAIVYRAEYFKDKSGIIIATETLNEFAIAGHSVNVDYSPVDKLLMRLEGRVFNNKIGSAVTFSTAVYF